MNRKEFRKQQREQERKFEHKVRSENYIFSRVYAAMSPRERQNYFNDKLNQAFLKDLEQIEKLLIKNSPEN